MWNIQRIKHIRSGLTREACETLVVGMVISHLDFANALLIGLPECEISRLQQVQNIAAKLVLSDGDSSYNCLKRLHWLPVRLRIQHKVLTLVYKCLFTDGMPRYLKDLLIRRTTQRYGLRSASAGVKLVVPFVRRETFAARSFSVMGPKWWNDLSAHIRNSHNVDTFKKKLKTFLFDRF